MQTFSNDGFLLDLSNILKNHNFVSGGDAIYLSSVQNNI